MWAERAVRGAVRALLFLYPRSFRLQYGVDFVDAALHRVSNSRRVRGSRLAGLGSAVQVLADTVTALPGVWARRLRAGRAPLGGRRPGREWLPMVAGDARVASRNVTRRPLFAALVVMTLGLGVGVSAAVFGALDRVILRPLPFPGGDRMAYLAIRQQERGWQFAPSQEVIDRWRAGSRKLERLEAYRPMTAVRSGDGAARNVSVVGVSAGMPSMLRIRPATGRMIGASDVEPGASPVVMLSERYWRSSFGAAASIAGATLRLNDTIFTVAGVWPESARLALEPPDLFRVLPRDEESPPGDFALIIGLIRTGATSADVESELSGLMAGAADLPDNVKAAVNPPYGFLGETYVRSLWLVFVAGLVLMLVAVVNAVNLMLSRATQRTGEVGVRLALGATMRDIARFFLVESALLASLGALAGAGVAIGFGRVMVALEPGRLVPAGATGLELRAMGFGLGLAIVACFVCGLAPLLHLRREGARALLSSQGDSRSSGGGSRVRTLLTSGQAAFAVLLVTGAVLLLRSFAQLTRIDTGMDIEKLVQVSVRAPEGRYETRESQAVFSDRVADVLSSLPGIRGVTTAPTPPLQFSVRPGLPILEGEAEPADASSSFISTTGAPTNYFDVLGIPIVAGRAFEPGERNAVIVNESFARTRQGSVLGRSLRFPGDTMSYLVVGVAADVRSYGLADIEDRIQLYYPTERSGAYTRFLLRAEGDPAAVLASARKALAEAEPDVPLSQATTGPEIVREQTQTIRFVAALLAGFSLLGLVFAVSGVYGAVTLDVSRRTREMGIRSALGATRRDLARLVLGSGMRPVIGGGATGALLALWAGPFLETVLFRIESRDPVSTLAGVLILATTAALACAIPALRAARTDPNRALRAE